MRWENWLFRPALWVLPVVAVAAPEEWRLQLLAEQHLPAETAGLKDLLKRDEVSEPRFMALVSGLGAEDFATREQAEKEMLRMGKAALGWLEHLPKSDDPEVRARLARIGNALRVERKWTTPELLRYAAETLLHEREGRAPDKTGRLVFAEFFHDKTASLKDGYRDFSFKSEPGLNGKVADGALWLDGNRQAEGDQRLVLEARRFSARKEFPDEFQIEVMLGGTAGGEGGYHVGVSVGNVRALFHPGYEGGGFRFERIDTHEPLTDNADMGYFPEPGEFQWMTVAVKRLPDKSVEMNVTISDSDDVHRFSARNRITPEVIGKLDAISLDRSGRTGGDGMFDNLVVDLPEHVPAPGK